MKLWNNIFDMWQLQNVPSIEIKKFDREIHDSTTPWFSFEHNRQIYSENPLSSTARYLCCYLPEKDDEFIAAFKILAFLKYYNSVDPWYNVLGFAMKKFGESPNNWWSPNAKNILPYTTYNNIYYPDLEKFIKNVKYVDKIVILASEKWTDISKQWIIMVLPNVRTEKWVC